MFGTIRFVDLNEDETIAEELDELTGLRQRVVIEDREKKLHPHIEIWQDKGGKEQRVRDFIIPVGAVLTVEDGHRIEAGTIFAKVSREAYKTRDITGGLPRVAELFEARKPKDPATIAEIDGFVKFGDIKRGNARSASSRRTRTGRPTRKRRTSTRSRRASTCACTRATACGRVTA